MIHRMVLTNKMKIYKIMINNKMKICNYKMKNQKIKLPNKKV